MALFYITGTSGSGKSSVQENLAQLGYKALDTDTSINDWHDRQTGQLVTFSPGKSEDPEETTKWVLDHDFLMSETKVRQLADEAKSEDIFICGHASNDINFMNYFNKVFCLLLSEEETRNRLSSRTNNTWGNDPGQLSHLMKWYKPMIERYENWGATMIDASLPVVEVVGSIIELTKS